MTMQQGRGVRIRRATPVNSEGLVNDDKLESTSNYEISLPCFIKRPDLSQDPGYKNDKP